MEELKGLLLERTAEGSIPLKQGRKEDTVMMIVMESGATQEQIDHVVERLAEVGAKAHISQGDFVTVIGAIGDREAIAALPLDAAPGVESVIPISKPYKLASREFRAKDTVIEALGRKLGAGHFALISGPCSTENREQVLAAAKATKAAGCSMLRGGAYKPRTSPYTFQGLGPEGLRFLSEAREITGLPVVTELLDPRDIEVVCEHSDILQIGTRNMQNFQLLAEAGKVDKPVLLKRGMSATINELLMAAEYILKEGNSRVILCERGIRTFETAYRNTLDISAIPVLKEMSHLPVVVDPSHAAGRRELVLPLSLAAIAAGADGLLVESHPDPENALSDGAQSLPSDTLPQFVEAVMPMLAVMGRSLS